MLTCTKIYSDIPFAHRAHLHDGHCRFIHGHNWAFEIVFAAERTDPCGFIVDFGKLKTLKQELDLFFDHSLILNQADPLAEEIVAMFRLRNIHNVHFLPDCSCEGIARFVFDMADTFVREESSGRAWCQQVTVHEDLKNYATYGTASQGH